jgi:hypothetical protein
MYVHILKRLLNIIVVMNSRDEMPLLLSVMVFVFIINKLLVEKLFVQHQRDDEMKRAGV